MCYEILQKYTDICRYQFSIDFRKASCFILAIINATINAVLLICCLYVEYRTLNYTPKPSDISFDDVRWGRQKRDAIDDHLRHESRFPALWLTIMVTALFSIATIIFSVLLCYGIQKRRPGYVQLYFVYGIIITHLIPAASVMHMCIDRTAGLGVFGLCGSAIHSLYLVLVYKVFKKMQQEAKYPKPALLQPVHIHVTPTAPPLEDVEDENCSPISA